MHRLFLEMVRPPGDATHRRMRSIGIGIFLAIMLAQSGSSLAQSNPVTLRDDIAITRIRSVPLDAIRIVCHPASQALFYNSRGGDIFRYDLSTEETVTVATSADHEVPEPRGMVISRDDQLYLLGNRSEGPMTAGIVRRAAIQDGAPADWTTVATTEPYPLSLGPFDHIMNALALSPDGRYLFMGSGSRTDHGEIEDAGGEFPGLREVPLTTILLRIPSDTTGMVIPNDSSAIDELGVRFASGFRNAFDLEWGPDGHLFGTENSGDRDDPEELNWIREGRHYGFPWRIGGNDTPQQFSDYDPESDPLLGPAIQPVFSNDPDYPKPPAGVTFVEPLANIGPDADTFRGALDGSVMDAGDLGVSINTFTPHRSPLGLVFDTAGALAEPFAGDGFVLSWTGSNNPLLGPLGDTGRDLLHLELTWSDLDSTYELSATKIAEGFTRPIDAVLVGSALYVMEMGFSPIESPSLWRLDLPMRSGASTGDRDGVGPVSLRLSLFPNPIASRGTIRLVASEAGYATVSLFDITGRMAKVIVSEFLTAGIHEIQFSSSALSPGVYIARMELGGQFDFVPIVRVR